MPEFIVATKYSQGRLGKDHFRHAYTNLLLSVKTTAVELEA